jgi:hypothetical protein
MVCAQQRAMLNDGAAGVAVVKQSGGVADV